MKKIGYAVFLGLFLVLCLVMSLGLAIFGPSQTGANAQLTETPQLINEDGAWNTDYLSDLQAWFNDRFFLRQELISLDRLLTGKLLGTSGESGVILGKDGWLYFADTLEDYTGINAMSDREIFSAAKNLSLMAEYCRENGKEFLFVIAPNKNSLYDAYMPNFGQKAELTNAERLMALLSDMGVETVDLFEAFREEDEILYFTHDSHWNGKGAALGADLINQAFGVNSEYYTGPFSEGERHDGDLFVMMYPAMKDTELDPQFGGKLNFEFTSNATRPDALVLNTKSDKGGSLMVYRDSFGNLLFPYLADSYGTARFARTTTYDLTVEAENIVVELVERNLRYLLSYGPVMPSPVREMVLPHVGDGVVSVEVGEKRGFTQVSGKLPAVDGDSGIYVACGDEIYEAFCMADGSFVANLPEGSEAEYVICTVNGADTAYKLQK